MRDVAQVTDFGWDYGSLPVASDQQAARYSNAGVLERVVRADGLSWLIQSGARRQVLDLGILTRYGIPAVSTAVSPAMLGEYATAAPVVGVGVYRDAKNPYPAADRRRDVRRPGCGQWNADRTQRARTHVGVIRVPAGDFDDAAADDLRRPVVCDDRERLARSDGIAVSVWTDVHRSSERRGGGHPRGRAVSTVRISSASGRTRRPTSSRGGPCRRSRPISRPGSRRNTASAHASGSCSTG